MRGPGRSAVVRLGAWIVAGGSLGWCLWLALGPANQAHLAILVRAPVALLGALLSLTVVSLGLNGVLFWVMLRPVRPLKVWNVVQVNTAIALLSYLPFKLGAAVRVAIHHRRDALSLATIGAWFAAMLVPMGLVLVPAGLAGVLAPRRADAWMLAGLTTAGGTAGVLAWAWWLRGYAGRERLRRWARRVPGLGRLGWGRLGVWADLHATFDMLASPSAMLASVLLRVGDLLIHGVRIGLAARVLGLDLTAGDVLPLAAVYVLVGAVSPAGQVGLREGATTGLAGLLLTRAEVSGSVLHAMATAALLLAAAEALVVVPLGLGALWSLRRWTSGPARAGGEARAGHPEPPEGRATASGRAGPD